MTLVKQHVRCAPARSLPVLSWGSVVHLYLLVVDDPRLCVVELYPLGISISLGRAPACTPGEGPIVAVLHALSMVNYNSVQVETMVVNF